MKDFIEALSETNPSKNYVFFIDTETSLSIFNEMALKAADRLIVPLTADMFCLSAIASSLDIFNGLKYTTQRPLFF